MTNGKSKTAAARKKVNKPGSTHMDQLGIDFLIAQAATPSILAHKAASAAYKSKATKGLPSAYDTNRQLQGLLGINKKKQLANIYQVAQDTDFQGAERAFVARQKDALRIMNAIKQDLRYDRKKIAENSINLPGGAKPINIRIQLPGFYHPKTYKELEMKRLSKLPPSKYGANPMILFTKGDTDFLAHEMGHAQQKANLKAITKYPVSTAYLYSLLDKVHTGAGFATIALAHQARMKQAQGKLSAKERDAYKKKAGIALAITSGANIPQLISEGGANIRALKLLKQTPVPANIAQKKRLAAAFGTYLTSATIMPSIAGVAYLTMPGGKSKKKSK